MSTPGASEGIQNATTFGDEGKTDSNERLCIVVRSLSIGSPRWRSGYSVDALCEPWKTLPFLDQRSGRHLSPEFKVRTDAIVRFSDWSRLRGSRKFCLLVTQGPQNLALGLTIDAASQLVEETFSLCDQIQSPDSPRIAFRSSKSQYEERGEGQK